MRLVRSSGAAVNRDCVAGEGLRVKGEGLRVNEAEVRGLLNHRYPATGVSVANGLYYK